MLARRWLPGATHWPRWLRSKWLAVVLVIMFLWAYEAFALWDSPCWTAWIALGYFIAAFVVDGLFRGASFCKYVCPIGQFNFVQSLVSPLEVKVRDSDVCTVCRTRDCIRGRDEIPGCEMELFQPRKSSNMDCTFCLDCVHACPHDNIGMLAGLPGKRPLERPRSLGHRPVRETSRPGGPHRGAGLRCVRQRRRDGRSGRGVARTVASLAWGISPALLVTSLYYLLGLLVLPLLDSWFGCHSQPRLGSTWRGLVRRCNSLFLLPGAAGIRDVASRITVSTFWGAMRRLFPRCSGL